MPVVNMSICSAVDSKYVSLILIRVILASDCSNEFLKKQMFPCRNGNNYEVRVTCGKSSTYKRKMARLNTIKFVSLYRVIPHYMIAVRFHIPITFLHFAITKWSQRIPPPLHNLPH